MASMRRRLKPRMQRWRGVEAVGWSKVFWQQVSYGSGFALGLMDFESFSIFIVPGPSLLALSGLAGLHLLMLPRGRSLCQTERSRRTGSGRART
jgi:hypothetical protein